MKHYLGVDIGTSGCKAAAFDDDGKLAASAYLEYNVRSPKPGWAELDSEEVIGACMTVIARCVAELPSPPVGLAVSSQGEAFTPVDAAGRPLGPAMVSSDNRAAQYVRDWPAVFGAERLYQITGHTAHSLFSLFKLLWLRDHQPDVWKSAPWFLCFEDLLLQRLGVEPAMGWPLAGRTMLFDVRRHTWSREILDAIGLDERRLARPLPSGSVAGVIPPEIARPLGLSDGTIAVTGGHDQACGALGAGITRGGTAAYATGTVECITPTFESPVFHEALRTNNLCTYDHAVEGLYITVAYSLTGGNLLKWFRDEFGQLEVQQARQSGGNEYDALLAQMSPHPARPMVLPYFTPTGTPYFDTKVTGAVLGLRLTSSRGEIIRSLLEGVAMEMRLNLEILQRAGCPVRELRAIGGGARSQAWSQLKADVLGRPVVALNVAEAGCMGAAMLVKQAAGGGSVADLAAKWVSVRAVYEPDGRHADWYRRRYELYETLYPSLSKLLSDETFSTSEESNQD